MPRSNYISRLVQVNDAYNYVLDSLSYIAEMRSENPSDQLLQLQMDRWQNDVEALKLRTDDEYLELRVIATRN